MTTAPSDTNKGQTENKVNERALDDVKLIKEATLEAGRIALSYFKQDIEVWEKSPENPVSEADIAVDEFLHATLMQNRSDYGWLSEETEDQPDRLNRDHVWIVDPIDGTRAYLAGRDDWGISIALVRDKRPVLAAFYAPVKDAFYFAEIGKGATKNGISISTSSCNDLATSKMMGDPTAFKASEFWPVAWPCGMIAEQANSIALRLCQIADAQFDCCVTLRPKNDWDVAAADLILSEAGGKLTTGDGVGLLFNNSEPLHKHIIAGTTPILPALMERVTPALEQWRKRHQK